MKAGGREKGKKNVTQAEELTIIISYFPSIRLCYVYIALA